MPAQISLLEVAPVAVEEHEAEAAEPEGAAHAHEAHRGHGGHAEAGDDGRQGERQLDGEQPPARRVAHGQGGVLHLGGHGAQALHEVPHEDGQGVDGQRDDERAGRSGPPRTAALSSAEQGQRRDRVEDVGDGQDRRVRLAATGSR